MTHLCKSADCASSLGWEVRFCPFCGTPQGRKRIKLSSHSTVAPDAKGAEEKPLPIASPQLPSFETMHPGEAPEGPSGDDMVFSPVNNDGASSHVPKTNWDLRMWWAPAMIALAVLLIIVGIMTGDGSGETFGTRSAAGSCDGVIDADLALFIDVRAPLSESTSEEILARLTEQLGHRFSGTGRITLFSTGQAGAVPLITVCATARLLAPLMGGNQVAAETRTQVLGVAQNELAQASHSTSGQTLTQLLANVSVSKYSRSPTNTLVVFSGLNEASPDVDLQSCTDVQAAIATYRAARAGGVERPVFRNITIKLNVIPDSGIGQSVIRCRRAFWNWYFGDFEGTGEGVIWDFLPGI